jgi:hypothetical protein
MLKFFGEKEISDSNLENLRNIFLY